MALWKREFRTYRFVIPVYFAAFLLLLFVFCRGARRGFMMVWAEEYAPLLMIVLLGGMYSSQDEIELTISSPVRTRYVFFAKASILFILNLATYIVIFPIAVCMGRLPAASCLFILFSYLTVVLFLGSLTILLRLVFQKAYISLPSMLIIWSTFWISHERVLQGLVKPPRRLKLEYVDLFYSEVPVHYAQMYPQIVGDAGWNWSIWGANRMIFFLLTLLCLLFSWLLLRRERLHS